jgi:tRNA(Arg) A34 adenosine deaminase TadA
MQLALLQARYAFERQEVPIGAVICLPMRQASTGAPIPQLQTLMRAYETFASRPGPIVPHGLPAYVSLGHAADTAIGCEEDLRQIVTSAHNSCVSHKDVTAHAEMIAFQSAMQLLDVSRLDGCTLYVTVEPCAMCLGAAALQHISRVVYAAPNDKFGGLSSSHSGVLSSQAAEDQREPGSFSPFRTMDVHHMSEFQEAAAALLKTFFRDKR